MRGPNQSESARLSKSEHMIRTGIIESAHGVSSMLLAAKIALEIDLILPLRWYWECLGIRMNDVPSQPGIRGEAMCRLLRINCSFSMLSSKSVISSKVSTRKLSRSEEMRHQRHNKRGDGDEVAKRPILVATTYHTIICLQTA